MARKREILTEEERKERQRAYARKWRSKSDNAKKANAATARWAEENPDAVREKHLKRTYGLTLAQYDELLERQGGACGACQGPPTVHGRFFVDHDHMTGRVRGLLCHQCNSALGYARDDLEVLKKLISYLKRNS